MNLERLDDEEGDPKTPPKRDPKPNKKNWYKLTRVAADGHDQWRAWQKENGHPPTDRIIDHDPGNPCQFCRLTIPHRSYPVCRAGTKRLFGFMCESPIPFPGVVINAGRSSLIS